MAEGGTPDFENQTMIIYELLKTSLKKDDTWYLIDTKWFEQWKKFVGWNHWDTESIGKQSANPGPIDNSTLFKEGSPAFLKENLIDELEYVAVPQEGWNKLNTWYGIRAGQNPIARFVMEQGMFVKHCKLEVYQLELKLACYNDSENFITKEISRSYTLEYIAQEMKRMFNIRREKPVRLWNQYMINTYEELSEMEKRVQDVGLYEYTMIVIEEQNDDGTWPRDGGTRVRAAAYVPAQATTLTTPQTTPQTTTQARTQATSSKAVPVSSQMSSQMSSQVSTLGSTKVSSKSMDSLTCGICFEKYNSNKHVPKLLPCQHTFCQNCITQITDRNRIPLTMLCPTCRQKHKVPADGFTMVRAILDIADELKKDSTKQGGTTLKCERHPIKEAVMVCIQCLHGLCLTCVKTSSSSHKDHQLEELDDAVPLLQKRVNNNMEAKKRVLQETIAQHQKSPACSLTMEKAKTTIKSIRDKVCSDVNSWATDQLAVVQQMEEVALNHESRMQSELESLNPHEGDLTTLLQELRQSEGNDQSPEKSQILEMSGYSQDKYEEAAKALLTKNRSIIARKYFD